MDPNYEDPNRQIMPAPSAKTSFMDYIRQNKLLVAIVILILIGLIWWFCIRKGNKTNVTTNITAPNAGAVPFGTNPSKVQVTRSRTVGGGMF